MIILDKYQQVSRDWLKQGQYRILADEPGVGKTHPVIFACKDFRGPKLVVCPSYLKANWEAELLASDEQSVVVVKGTMSEKKACIKLPATWKIVSYETFAKSEYNRLLRSTYWQAVIFDEAHRLKGRNSNRTAAAYTFRAYTARIYMLTGTPIVSNGGDLFPLLKICDPVHYSSYWSFVDENCKVTLTPWGKKVGKPKNLQELENKVRPFMLRRSLASIFPKMPPVIHRDIIVEIPESFKKTYKRAKDDYLVVNPDGKKTRIGAGGLVSALRTITVNSGAKDEALLGLLEDIPEDEQVVVFAWYRESVSHLVELLPGAFGFHGGIGQTDRDMVIEAFKNKTFRILTATLSTMKEGVNLQNARHVIFYEEDWVAATNEQAVARLHRRGQTDTVFSYSLVTKGTVDDKVHKAALRRGAMSLNEIFDEIWEETTD